MSCSHFGALSLSLVTLILHLREPTARDSFE
jgi:hypothetical protein